MGAAMEERKLVPQGALILEQGVLGDDAYVIESGKVGISMQNQQGDEIFLAELGPGAVIGEMAAIFGGGRCANARAQEDVVLHIIPGAVLRQTLEASSAMNGYFRDLIEQRRRDMQIALDRQWQEKYSGC